jgi:steroid delta-isomerase-like uncharacterized protein
MRSPIVLGVVMMALTACFPRGGPSPTLARNEIVAYSLIDAWQSGDRDVLTDLFWPAAVYDDFANQVQYQGIQEIVGYVQHVQAWADGLSIDVAAVFPSEEGATVEWVFSAVQVHPIGDRMPVATGREVVLNGVTILEIENGRIRRAADYVDAMALVLQLGAEVHMPGGSVVRLDDVLPPIDTAGLRP